MEKAKRAFGEARALELVEPGANRIPDRCLHGGEPCPGAPWQGLDYERPARREVSARSMTRFAASAASTASSSSRSSPPRSCGGIATSSSTRSGAATASWCSASILAEAGPRWSTSRTAISPRSSNNAARNEVRDWARREGIPADDPRGSGGVLKNLVVREGIRTGQVQTRLVTAPGNFAQASGRPPHRGQGPGARRRGDRGARRGAPAREARGTSILDLPHRLLSDQHRDGGAALRDRRRVRGPIRPRAGVRPLLRDRDDRPDARLAGRRGVGRRVRARSRRRREAKRPGQPDRERALRRRRRSARGPPAARAGRAAGRRDRRSAARRPLEEGGPAGDRVRCAPDRLRLVQPHHAGAERRTARGGRL